MNEAGNELLFCWRQIVFTTETFAFDGSGKMHSEAKCSDTKFYYIKTTLDCNSNKLSHRSKQNFVALKTR